MCEQFTYGFVERLQLRYQAQLLLLLVCECLSCHSLKTFKLVSSNTIHHIPGLCVEVDLMLLNTGDTLFPQEPESQLAVLWDGVVLEVTHERMGRQPQLSLFIFPERAQGGTH